MRPPGIARKTGAVAWIARRTRHTSVLGGVSVLDGVPGSGRGSAALGVAIVAVTTRIHHYGTSHGTGSTWGFILAAVVIVIFGIVRFIRYRRN